jgi:hypothetical protein
MTARLLTCRHCQGTTYCGARRTAEGKVKLGPACPSCLAKSDLSPTGVFVKVVCSVCAGRGVVEPVAEVGQGHGASRGVLVFALVLCVLGLVGVAVSAYVYYRAVHAYDDPIKMMMDDDGGPVREMTRAEVLQRVPIGMSKAKVKELLGEPDRALETQDPQGTDVWVYRCSDGRMQITFQVGVVYGRYAGR